MKKIFCDECVFGLTVNFLKVEGLDIVRAQDLGLSGASNEIIYAKAQELKRILVTNDQGFGDIRKYKLIAPAFKPGIKMQPQIPGFSPIILSTRTYAQDNS